jgi:Ca-activated chloride channel family protein
MSTMPATVEAGLLARGAKAKPIPLLGVTVEATLRDYAAKTTLTQRYANAEKQPIEAIYVFPLDEAAAVCGFEAEIDGRRVVARVEEREKAFEAYDDALAAGHGAYLLDQETPDVFTASLGNIPPGAEVLVRITTVAELPLEGDDIRFTVPTTVSPRYAPEQDRKGVGPTKADRLNPPRAWDVPYGLGLTVTVEMSGRVRSLESPSHSIRVDGLEGGRARVELATRDAALDRDFVLKVGLEEPLAPLALLETGPDGPGHALASFRPALDAAQEAPVEVVFVVDRSGSMMGTSIAEAKSALKLALRSLRPGSFFNVVGFGNEYVSLFPESRAYADDTLAAAVAHVETLEGDMGGTEIRPALEFVLGREPRRGVARRVVLLTDGQVTNTDDVIALVRQHSTHTRVFTFGIGEGASRHLVRGVARAGEGAAEFIAPGERIGPKVLRQLGRVVSPGLTDLRVEWSAPAETAPHYLPPVFAGERILVYARLKTATPGAVTLRGRGPSGEASFTVVPRVATDDERVLGTLWARAAIRDLEEGRSALHDRRGSLQERGHGDRVRSEIVRLAKAYGLASRETSFVAVEERDTPTEARAELRRVPIALTRGWGGADRVTRSVAFAPAMPPAARMAMPSMAAAPAPPSGFLGGWRTLVSEAAPSPDAMEYGGGPASLDAERPGLRAERALDRLAGLQKADGSWELSEGLAVVLGTSLPAIEGRAADLGLATGEGRRAWATVLALAWLETRAAADRDEWALLAAKAREWLRRQAGPAGPAAWTRAAGEFVESLRV